MRISSVSTYDYVTINGNVRALYSDRYNCKEEMLKIKTPERKKAYVSSRGCGVVVKHTIDRIDNIKYNTCLCKVHHPMMDTLLTMNDCYERGVLPFRGSLMDQPAQAIEVLQVVNNACTREKEEIKKKAAERVNNGRR